MHVEQIAQSIRLPPPQPQPSPDVQKAQMQAQTQKELKQMEIQDSAQKFQAGQQSQMAVDANRQEWEARQKQLELQQEAQLEQIRKQFEGELADREFRFKQWLANFDRETKVILAGISAQRAQPEQ